MKKFLLIGLFAFLALWCYADEYSLGSVPVLESPYYSRQEVLLKYEDSTNQYYLQIKTSLYLAWIELSEEQLKSLRTTTDKAIEWGKIAEENAAQMAKEIPNSKLNSKIIWTYAGNRNDVYESNKFSMIWQFAGLVDSWCILLFPANVSSSQNRYITYDQDTLVMSKSSVIEFKKILSEESIKKAKAEHDKKKKQNDELFS